VHGSIGAGLGERGRGGYVVASGSRERGEDFVFPEFADVTDDVGRVSGLDRDRALNVFATAGIGDVTLQARATERRKVVPTASYETTPGDARFFTRDRALAGSVSYEHAFEDLSRIWASADYAFSSYDAEYPYGELLNRDELGGHSVGLETAYLRVLGAGHKVVAGGDVRRHFKEYQRNFDLPIEGGRGIAPGPAPVLLDEGYSSWAAGAFLQTELRLASAVRLSSGVRYDWRQDFGGAVSPRVALVLRPDAATSLRVGYGRTTRLPSVMERFYDDGGYSWKASDSLGAERVGTVDASVQRAFAGGWRASVTGYDLRATRQIVQVVDPADGLLVYVNAGVIGSRGIELELEGRIAGAATLRGSYAYQRARVDSSGTLPASPRHLAHLSAVVPIAGGRLSLAASARAIGARRTLAGNPLPATGVVGLGLTARPFASRDVDLDLHVRNLFDNRYPDVATLDHLMETLPQTGRRMTVGVRYRWR
jgi:iron complex outermembrane receptor protein